MGVINDFSPSKRIEFDDDYIRWSNKRYDREQKKEMRRRKSMVRQVKGLAKKVINSDLSLQEKISKIGYEIVKRHISPWYDILSQLGYDRTRELIREYNQETDDHVTLGPSSMSGGSVGFCSDSKIWHWYGNKYGLDILK